MTTRAIRSSRSEAARTCACSLGRSGVRRSLHGAARVAMGNGAPELDFPGRFPWTPPTSDTGGFARKKEKALFSRTFGKPSDGLELSTPSSPRAPNGKRSQPTATVFACSAVFGPRRIAIGCDGLQPGGSVKAPSSVSIWRRLVLAAWVYGSLRRLRPYRPSASRPGPGSPRAESVRIARRVRSARE